MVPIVSTSSFRRSPAPLVQRQWQARCVLVAFCLCSAVVPPAEAATDAAEQVAKTPPKAKLDHSGKARKGKASYYSRKFAGKKMANGEPMNPKSNVAASKTLPLGTRAKVTNLDNGKSAVVEIQDRGPYVGNRIVDVTPKTAKKLDIDEKGVAPVVVAPIAVPQPDGSVKPGVAAPYAEQDQRRP